MLFVVAHALLRLAVVLQQLRVAAAGRTVDLLDLVAGGQNRQQDHQEHDLTAEEEVFGLHWQ